MNRDDIRSIDFDSPQYPRLLKNIQRPPRPLWMRGAGLENERFHLACIGSREADVSALLELRSFLEQVCTVYADTVQFPLVIVSGLAKGIDRVSHEVGLAQGHTVGVLPTSINRMYPAENLDIANQILDVRQPGSAIVSEYPPVGSWEQTPWNALARNRITVGMSDAVLVAGADNPSSGTLSAVAGAYQEFRPIYYLADTISANVRRMLTGVYGAIEVSDPAAFVETLLKGTK